MHTVKYNRAGLLALFWENPSDSAWGFIVSQISIRFFTVASKVGLIIPSLPRRREKLMQKVSCAIEIWVRELKKKSQPSNCVLNKKTTTWARWGVLATRVLGYSDNHARTDGSFVGTVLFFRGTCSSKLKKQNMGWGEYCVFAYREPT